MTAPLAPDAPTALRSIVRFCRASGYTGSALLGYARQVALASRLRVTPQTLEALVTEYSAAAVCSACNGRGVVIPTPKSPTLPYGPDDGCDVCEGEGWVWPSPEAAAP